MLYHTILYYTILYYTILYYTILYYTILYYIALYHTIPQGHMLVSQEVLGQGPKSRLLSTVKEVRATQLMHTAMSGYDV